MKVLLYLTRGTKRIEPSIPGNPAKISCKPAPQVRIDAAILGHRGQRARVELVGQHVHLHKHQRQNVHSVKCSGISKNCEQQMMSKHILGVGQMYN